MRRILAIRIGAILVLCPALILGLMTNKAVLGQINKRALLNEAQLYEERGDWQEALKCWKEYLKKHRKELKKEELKIVLDNIKNCKYESIVSAFEKKRKKDYREVCDAYFSYKRLSILYHQRNEFEKSTKCKQRMLALETAYPDLKINPPRSLAKKKDEIALPEDIKQKIGPPTTYVSKIDNTSIENFIGVKGKTRSIVHPRSIKIFDEKGRLIKEKIFNWPIESVASKNRKYLGIFKKYWDYGEVVEDKAAPDKIFSGIIDAKGNILWVNDKIDRIDKISNNGKVAVALHFPWGRDRYIYFYHSNGSVAKVIPYRKPGIHRQEKCDISNDGKYIAYSFSGIRKEVENGMVILYKNTGEEIWRYQSSGWLAPDIAISAGGKYIIIVDSQGTYLFNYDKRLIWHKESYWPAKIIFSQDEKYVFFTNDNRIICYEAKRGKLFWKYVDESPLIKFRNLVASDHGEFVLASAVSIEAKNYSKYVYLFNQRGKLLWEKEYPNIGYRSDIETPRIHISFDGKLIAVVTPQKIYDYQN